MLEQARVIEREPPSPLAPIGEHIDSCPVCRAQEKQRAMELAGFEVDLANHEETCEACERWDNYSSDEPCKAVDEISKDFLGKRFRGTLCPQGRALYEGALNSA